MLQAITGFISEQYTHFRKKKTKSSGQNTKLHDKIQKIKLTRKSLSVFRLDIA